MPLKHRSRPGYIFLVTVLVIGVIATATASSLLLLGWAAEQNGLLMQQTNQAFEYAQTCAERAMRSLRSDLGYVGETTYAFSLGSCEIKTIGGAGNEKRTLCVAGYSGDSVRRMEASIDRLYPTVTIRSWQEVSAFSLCP